MKGSFLHKRAARIALLIAVALLAAGSAAGAVVTYLRWPPMPGDLRKVSADALGNTPGNSANGGMAVQAGDSVFYCDPEASGIYRVVPGGEPVLICADKALGLNVVGDWIYYGNRSDNRRIYRVKFDGTGRAKVSDLRCYNMLAVGPWLYIAHYDSDIGQSLYRVRADGKRKELLARLETVAILPAGGRMFAQMANRLFVFKTDLEEITAQGEKRTEMEFALIEDGWVYYASPEKALFKMRLDGSGNAQLLASEEVRRFNIDGNWLYYANCADQYKLYRVRLDGTGKEKVSDDRVDDFGINLVNGGGYYTSNLYQMMARNQDGSGDAYLAEERVADIGAGKEWLDKVRGGAEDAQSAENALATVSREDATSFTATDQAVFYGDANGIYQMKHDGTERTLVIGIRENERIERMAFADGWLYYVNSNLYRVHPQTGEIQRLSEKRVLHFALQEGKVYFLTAETPFIHVDLAHFNTSRV